MIERTCKQCGKKFMTGNSPSRKDRGKFCSRKCSSEFRITSVKKICLACGKRFMVWPWRLTVGGGKYCSRECYFPNKSFVKKCKVCGNDYRVYPYQLKLNHADCCSKKCYVSTIRTNHYEKHIKKFARDRARKKALKVFKPICVICGEPEDHCHHKDCDPTNNNITNLCFLCELCHIDIHREIRERAG